MKSSRRVRAFGATVIALCILAILGASVIQVRAWQGVTFAVTVSEQNLIAGSRTRVGFTLLNNSTRDVTDLDAKLTVSATSPLVFMTDNWWHFYSVSSNQTVSFSTDIYAPTSSIGGTYPATLTLAYNVSSTSRPTEDHALGFVVYGKVDVTTYGVTVDPTPTTAGGNVTISANLLNKGNVAASYVNVTLRGELFSLRPGSTTYIGTLDPNSPTPITLTANIWSDVPNGTYPVTLVVSYRDPQSHDVQLLVPATVVVAEATKTSTPTAPTGGLRGFTMEGLLIPVGGVVVAAIVVGALLYRRRRSSGKSPTPEIRQPTGGA